MNKKMFIILALTIIMLCVSACGKTDNKEQSSVNNTSNISNTQSANLSGTVPDELEYIPDGYENPATQQGTLNKLTYDTWESFSYEQKSNKITKEAWVYLPYGYTDEEEYNVFYLSHGGWSNETTLMGTDDNPKSFKNVIDNAIQDGNIKPLIIVLPTYNNTSENDSSDYSLAIQLTNQFHNELVNDLIPAVESKYSTYAKDTTPQGLKESRDHRGFGGFSMGSVNTWNTFRYCLDYFRYFMPMSGSYTTDGEYMADLVRQQGYSSQDFFIFAASGTDDFAYSAFKAQIMAMANNSGGMFKLAKNESEGNMSFLEREGYKHDAKATDEYTYNGLRFFWNGQTDTQSADNQGSSSKAYNVEQGTSKYRDFVLDNVLHSETEGDIHYNVYIPEDYDGTESYALFMTLPGYQGLYFQGVGQNVMTEEFGFMARDYISKMIIVAPQLNDWQDTSARQTIALTEYFLDTYNIDRSRVYAEGYSGGGETMSRVMGMRPDLYTAYLQCSSQWDGNYTEVVKARVPVYFAIGEKDEYYGSEPSRNAYNAIHKLYEQEGLSNSEIDRLLVLDIKPTSYFSSEGISNQHGYGGYLFVRDKNIMGWLFGQVKK
jgi:predicted peptidase/enterochelin esterase-like enzyme